MVTIAFALLQTRPGPAPQGPQQAALRPAVGRPGGVPAGSEAEKQRARAVYAKLPLYFEPNVGQTAPSVKFMTRGSRYRLFLESTDAVMALRDGRKRAVVRMELEGANRSPGVQGLEPLEGIVNYFIGNDPAKWHTNVPTFGKVKYECVYPGVNLVYYGTQQRLEYDFVVAPGRDPEVIRLRISGARAMEVNPAGDLVLTTEAGEVKLAKPALYQEVQGAKREVAGGFRLINKDEAGFEVGRYDRRLPLVIDPTLVYSTYLGGSDPTLGDQVMAVAVDSMGEAYATGRASSMDFPTKNAFQPMLGTGGTENAFITKFAANGTTLLFSTFLGGSSRDFASAIAVDAAGNAYIAGHTTSMNFPKTNPSSPGLNGPGDAFVAKLSANGSALMYSFYLGGNNNDNANGIAVDASGNAYVAGFTDSFSMFPVTAGAFQSALGGTFNGFVAKISSTGTITWATYLGGSADDEANAIAVDSSLNVHVTGIVHSANFPVTTNAFQSSLAATAGGSNAFVSVLNPTGTGASQLVYSTYLGGSTSALLGTPNLDHGTGIAVDSGGNTVVTGVAFSSDFPVASTFQAHDPGVEDLFVAKFASSGALLFSTLFGDQSGETEANAVALDSSDNIYLTGFTSALFFPTLDPLQATTQAGTSSDFDTAFVLEIKSDASDYLFSTFLGGSQNTFTGAFVQDLGFGIAVDSALNIYVGGSSATSDFPTLNPFQATLKSTNSNGFVAKISPATPTGPQVFPAALNLGTVNVGSPSAPQLVTVANGTNTLLFTSITIAGTNAADFSEADSCGPELLPHVVCTIAVTATPTATGTRTAMLQISDSDPSSPQLVMLTATGATPPPPPSTGTVTITPPASMGNFGPQEVGTTSGSSTLQVYTVLNTGTVTVNLLPTITGANPGDFSFGFTTCFSPLGPGLSCAVSVQFRPLATGPRSASLQISGNFTGSPQSFSLSGTGTPPIAVLSPSFASIGNQVIGTTSSPQVFTLMNTSATVSLTGIAVTFSQFPSTAGFVISANSCGSAPAPGTLAPGTSCTISVTFAPTATGFASASIQVMDSDPARQVASVTGTGLNPVATLAPLFTTQILFGRQNIGSTSPASFVSLTNLGNMALVFTVSFSGTNSGDFSETDTCSATIAAGSFCSLQVFFTPVAVGPRTATLTINSSTTGVTGVPQSISLSGTGVTATMAALAPTSLIFPNTPMGVPSAPLLVTFSNTGNRPLVVTGGGLSGANPGDFSFRPVQNAATVGCASGGSFLFFRPRFNPQVACPISFVFTPSGTGTRTATFTIMDTSSNSPHTVMLQGTGGSACINWVGPATGGNWSTATNWSSGAVPGAGQDACLLGASVLIDSSLPTANQSINSFSGPGSLTIGNVNGPFTIASAPTITNLTITAGSGLTGAGNLTISGLFTWNAGAMAGTGTTTANGGIAMGFIAAGAPTLGRTLINNGIATFNSNPLPFAISSGGTFVNSSGSTMDIQTDGVSIGGGGNTGTVTNMGTIMKSAGTGASSIDVNLNSTGTIMVNSGTLVVDTVNGLTSATISGPTTIAMNAALNFNGLTATVSGSVSGAGSTNFSFSNVTFSGAYNISGTTTLATVGTTVNFNGPGASLGPLTVLNGSVVNFNPAGTVSGVGPLTINGSTANFTSSTANIPITGLTLTGGGLLTGTDAFNINGPVNWTGGTMDSLGSTNRAATLTTGPITLGNATLLSRTFNANANVTLNGTLSMGGVAPVFNLGSGFTFNDAGDNSIVFASGVTFGFPTFNNAGTFMKSAGTGIASIQVVFNNTGSVSLASGSLILDGGGGGTGGSGNGSFAVSSGLSLIFAAGTYNLGGSFTGPGTVDVVGSSTPTVNFTSGASATGLGALGIGPGIVTLASGVNLGVTTVTVVAGGILTGVGTITGNVTNGGVVHAATSTAPGTLSINGTYSQTAGGRLGVDIAGIGAGQFSQLLVTGAANLDGTISGGPFGSFMPSVGNMVTPVQAGSVVGTFATNSLAAPAGDVWNLTYVPAAAPTMVVATLAAAAPPAVTLTPPSASFGNVPVGSRGTQTVTLTNSGGAPLLFAATSPFSISGTNAGDFTVTSNTCPVAPTTLAVNASCNFTLNFMPAPSGISETATLMISDNAANSPQSVPLTGTGLGPVLHFTPPTGLNFGSQTQGLPSPPMMLRVDVDPSFGDWVMPVISIRPTNTSTGPNDFTQTNNCGARVPSDGNCIITVTFTPSNGGNTAESANLILAGNQAGSPNLLPLTGTGTTGTTSFTFAPAPGGGTMVTIRPGDTGRFNLMLNPSASSSGTVNFTCSINAPDSRCTVTPTNAPLTGSTPVPIVADALTNCTIAPPRGGPRSLPPGTNLPVVGLLALLAVLALGLTRRVGPRSRFARLAPALALLLLVITWAGCGGGAGSDPPLLPNQPSTPPGTYTMTVTATSGAVTQSISLTVRVI